jgi:predicted transcriptional regulator
MNPIANVITSNDTLHAVLDIFEKTGFAFVPITIDDKVVTALSLRDLLKMVSALELDVSISQLASSLISAANDTSIGNALETMLEQGVRNLIIKDNGSATVLNDRKVLEFLLSHEGLRATAQRWNALFDIKVNVLDLLAAKRVGRNTSVSKAAMLLTDLNTPCLLVDNSVVTPWDVVVKGLLKS